jgi:hypothetical protein
VCRGRIRRIELQTKTGHANRNRQKLEVHGVVQERQKLEKHGDNEEVQKRRVHMEEEGESKQWEGQEVRER